MTEIVGPRKARPVPSVSARAPRSVQRRGPTERAAGRFDHHRSGPIQRTPLGHDAAPPVDSVDGTVRGPGSPIPTNVRQVMEAGFGHRFENVRIHTDDEADRSARAYGALAYTVGSHIAFQAGSFDPSSQAGQRLIAHELTHVLQQRNSPDDPLAHATPTIGRAGDAHEQEADRIAAAVATPIGTPHGPAVPAVSVRPTSVPHIQRQAGTGVQQQPTGGGQGTGAAPVNPADDAVAYLENMARFVEGLRTTTLAMGRTPTAADRQRTFRILNQDRIARLLEQARSTFEAQYGLLPPGDTHRIPLRRAYQGALEQLRLASEAAFQNSEAMDVATRDSERLKHLQNQAAWINVVPTTESGLAGATLGADDVALAQLHEQSLEAYLNDLVTSLPTANLTQAQKNDILERIRNGVRRAFVTVGAGPTGTIDVRSITNPRIAALYRRVTALLTTAIGGPPLNVITDQFPTYQLPTPVPNVTAQLTVQADVTHVPADERLSVLFGIDVATRIVIGPPSTVTLRNAVWPVVLQVRRGNATVGVRYELNFDAAGNVRAERLGEATPRELPVAFTQLSVADKKARIVADFGLVAVDDRPANGARPAANWAPGELDQLKAAYDLLPVGDRAALAGVSVVRDHTAPPGNVPGLITAGYAHTSADAAFDTPGPPPHSPPHIHYFDFAFTANAVTAVGAPGASGPGADWTLIHEVGHIRMFAATTAANAQIVAANAQIAAANLRLPQLNAPIPVAVAPSRQAWSAARTAANTAIHAFHTAVLAGSGPAALAPLLAAAQAAVQARDRARANMTTVGVPAGVVAAALALDSAMDALLAASQATGAAKQQLPTFSSLAARFGFQKFTDYARRSVGDDEWFAETYALFVTDPDRLNQMSRNLFLWFSAGMPMDPNWNPPP